jgi:hypothetical protein
MRVSVSARLTSQANSVDRVSSPESCTGNANRRVAIPPTRRDGRVPLGVGASSVVGMVSSVRAATAGTLMQTHVPRRRETRFCQTELDARSDRD